MGKGAGDIEIEVLKINYLMQTLNLLTHIIKYLIQ
jgi:hypothetical protein